MGSGSMMKGSGLLVLAILQLVMLAAAQDPTLSAPLLRGVMDLPQRIDTHAHFVPPFYRELLASRGISAGGLPIPVWNETAHLEFNDQQGIGTSVLSISTPAAKLSQNARVEEGRDLARQLNEYGSKLAQEYPGRFLFWATLTLPDLDGAVAEAIYALDTLGAAGIALEPSHYGEILGTPRYAPLYKVLDDRKAVVFVHPGQSPCPGEQPEFTAESTTIPPFVADFLLDTSRAALNLVFRNVTTDYPNIKFILAHSGGFIPFAATRMSDLVALVPGGSGDTAAVYYQRLKEFYADIALSATDTALVSTMKFFADTQLTFGTDYPYAPENLVRKNTGSLLAYPNLHNAARRKLDYDNAYGLLNNFLR